MPDNYLITARKRQGDAFVATPGPVRFIKVPRGAHAYTAAHGIPPDAWVNAVRGLADGDTNPLSISPTGDVLVFVHGFNNDMAAVLQRQEDLRQTLEAQGWRGEVVAFDWPSGNTVLNYIEDRMDATAVAGQLVFKCLTLLMAGQQANCVTNVHLLGHSTGAYVILEAFAQAERKREFYQGDWRIGQVALIGADVSQSSLGLASDWSKPMFKRIMRLTNYSSGSDAVLAVSNAKRLGVSPRVGRVGLPEVTDAKAINVNCTTYFNGLPPPARPDFAYCHSWHFRDPVFCLDLAMTLEGAIDRHAIPTRTETARGLALQFGLRPAFQAGWGIEQAAGYFEPRA